MSDACEKWMALSDRDALGDALMDDERTFLAHHGARCAVCAREQAVWEGLQALMPAPCATSESSATAAVPRAGQSLSARAGRGAVAAGALIACAAAVLLLVLGAKLVPGTSAAPKPAPQAASEAPGAAPQPVAYARLSEARAGVAEVDGQSASPGSALAEGALVFSRGGAVCLTVEPGVRACLSPGSLMRVAELSAARRRLELLHGKLVAALAPQPPGTSFGVVTRDGSAIAVGTAFSVEVPAAGGPVVTRVLHGTVLVQGSAGRERQLTAHRMTSMDGEPRALPAGEEARERALIEQPSPPALPLQQPATDDATALVESARASGLSAHAYERHEPTGWPSRRGSAAERASAARPSELDPQDHAPPPRSASELLSSARQARARSDMPAARAAYRALFAHHVASAEAHAARVPYGELLLADAAPKAALREFERYLEQSGPLSEEASFGRIRALRAIGDPRAERAALQSFLDTYPESPLHESLAARARALGDP